MENIKKIRGGTIVGFVGEEPAKEPETTEEKPAPKPKRGKKAE